MNEVWREDLDDEDYQVREVFARYGRAMYTAQVMERGLINVLALASLEWPWTPEAYDACWGALARKTLGPLVKECERQLPQETELLTKLRGALGVRNLLAHDYFWEKAAAFTRPAGREEMLADFLTIHEQFAEVDAVTHAALSRVAAVLGFDPEERMPGILAQHEAEALERWPD